MNVKLNYKEFGSGYPLIILHGLFGMLDNWQTLAKRFAEHYHVYIVDQRDHGKSPHTDAFSYDLLADDLSDFINEHHIEKPNILGHSMGGKTAIRFAQKYPEAINKLIVVDIAPRSYKGGHERILDAMLQLDIANMKSRKEADEALAKQIPNAGVRMFLLKNLKRTENGYAWKANFELLRREYDSLMNDTETSFTSDVDALFIRGEYSDYITDEDEILIATIFKNVHIETIAEAGHWVHAQKPNELFELVERFIGQ